MPDPLYTAANVRLAYELRWSLAVFWTQPAPEPSWFPLLQKATDPDGVRILEHRYTTDNVSQFLVSTKPHVAPADCVRSVKGRLHYLLRADVPKAFRRNYSMHSLGTANREAIEQYVASQVQHHPMADPRVDALLAPLQFTASDVDLGAVRRSGHGEFVYNLHFVAVHQERYAELREDVLRLTLDMVRDMARKKGHLLSRVGLLVDHVHWTVGCDVAEAPLQIGLSYLNNLAYAHGMQAVFQFGFYVGTFGRYDMNAVRRRL